LGDTVEDQSKLKPCFDKLDNFSKELAHKKRFNSHFAGFKKDIMEHIEKFKLALIELDRKQPYIRTD